MKHTIIQLLFPYPARGFRGQRWLNVLLRSLHLVGIAGISGGFLFDEKPDTWGHYWHLALASGVALMALYLWGSVCWLFELKGLVIVLKTLLLGIALLIPSIRAELFLFVVILSGVIAHAPGTFRGYRWIPLPATVSCRPDAARTSAPPKQRRTGK
jgi:hypothetical protein